MTDHRILVDGVDAVHEDVKQNHGSFTALFGRLHFIVVAWISRKDVLEL